MDRDCKSDPRPDPRPLKADGPNDAGHAGFTTLKRRARTDQPGNWQPPAEADAAEALDDKYGIMPSAPYEDW